MALSDLTITVNMDDVIPILKEIEAVSDEDGLAIKWLAQYRKRLRTVHEKAKQALSLCKVVNPPRRPEAGAG